MSKKSKSLIYAAIIGLAIVAIGLSFLSSWTSPVAWILIALLILIPRTYDRASSRKFISWHDSYSVGVEALDNDHKQLIVLINQFKSAYEYQIGQAFEEKALEDLVDYTKKHFSYEESLMMDANYPDLKNHQEEHQVMINKVAQMVEQYKKDGHQAFEQLNEFLSDWLINHINVSDKKYSSYLVK